MTAKKQKSPLEKALWKWSRNGNADRNYESHFNIFMSRLGDDKECFSFVRICDGELFCLKYGKSRDGKLSKDYVIQLNKDLEALVSLSIESYENDLPNKVHIAVQSGDKWVKQWNIGDKAAELKKLQPAAVPAALFSWSTVTGRAYKLFVALNEHKAQTILVAPSILCKNQTVLKNAVFVETPETQCWEKELEIQAALKQQIDKFPSAIILYCCSTTAKRLILKNCLSYGNKITQIDFGANLCPYSDMTIRPWHQGVCLSHQSRKRQPK